MARAADETESRDAVPSTQNAKKNQKATQASYEYLSLIIKMSAKSIAESKYESSVRNSFTIFETNSLSVILHEPFLSY